MSDVAHRDPRREIVDWLTSERIVEQVKRALPDHVPIDWFLRCAQTSILMNADLATADKSSLLRELVAIAQLGLVMDPQLGEAWLIIDQNKRVQRRVGYQGLRKLCLQSGDVVALNAQAVYANDHCEIDLGDHPRVRHTIDVQKDDRGKLLGCYALGRIDGSDMPVVEWMSWKQIEAHRDRYSQAGKRGPWGDPLAEIEMGRKTVFRRLAKWLPKSPLLAEALAHEDRVDMRDVTPGMPELPAPEESEPSPLAPQVRRTGSLTPQPEEEIRSMSADELDALIRNNPDREDVRLAVEREVVRRSGGEDAPERPAEAQTARRRGRPPGSRNKPRSPAYEPQDDGPPDDGAPLEGTPEPPPSAHAREDTAEAGPVGTVPAPDAEPLYKLLTPLGSLAGSLRADQWFVELERKIDAARPDQRHAWLDAQQFVLKSLLADRPDLAERLHELVAKVQS